MLLFPHNKLDEAEDASSLSPDLRALLHVLRNAPRSISELVIASSGPETRLALRDAGVVEFANDDPEMLSLRITKLGRALISAV